jgi:hypothetical protein
MSEALLEEETIPVKVVEARSDAALRARLAAHASPEVRAFGRILATPIGTAVHAFISDELTAGTAPADIAYAITKLFGSVVGTVIVATTPAPDDRDSSAENFVILFGRIVAAHLDEAEAAEGARSVRQ